MAEKLSTIMKPHANCVGGLIKALRAVQEEVGHLPPETEAAGAEIFNLSKAEVKGVIGFYSDFHRGSRGETIVRLCGAEACQALGGRALQDDLEKILGLKLGATSADAKVKIEPVFCLGLCSVGPAATNGDRLVARATAPRIAQEVERKARERD